MADISSALRDDKAGLRAISPAAPLGLHWGRGVIYSLSDVARRELFRFGEGTENPYVRADRGKLRDWLRQDVSVEWGKRFKGYEEHPGGVIARFEDGTEARGSVLVGADCISSQGMCQPSTIRILLTELAHSQASVTASQP